MARALVTRAVQFPPSRRGEVLADLRLRRDSLRQHHCSYWLFEDPAMPGLLIEFLEARDATTLRTAQQAISARADAPILSEVEL